MKLHQRSVLVVALAPLAALALILAAGFDGIQVFGLPLFAVAIGAIFAIQWAAYIPAYIYQTEAYFDLIGSVTYATVAALAMVAGASGDLRSVLLGLLVIIWAVRLGLFLYQRTRRNGGDGRFQRLMPDWRIFLMVWTLQALWISITLSCTLVAITSADKVPFGGLAAVGLAIWTVGFTIEVVADRQKQAFRADRENAGRFITTGLWAWSRHPNYFGEIVLWTGIALMALPVLSGWQYLLLISPVFVIVLLTRISGIPLLENRNDRNWSGDPDYEGYKANTPVLIPRPPRGGAPTTIQPGG